MPRPEDFGAVRVGPKPEDFGATPISAAPAAAPQLAIEDTTSNWLGIPEAALSIASGPVAQSIGGLAGIGGAVWPGPTGQGADVAQKVASALTYEPRSGLGKGITEVAAIPGEAITKVAKKVGARGAEVSPMLGTIGETSVQALPLLLGSRAGMKGKPALTQEQAEAVAARKAGMKLTPEEMQAGPIAKGIASIAGEPSLARKISAKNQALWHDLMSEDLGLKKGDVIDRETLDNIRQQEGASYELMRNTGTIKPDAEFHAKLDETVKDLEGAAKDFEHRQESPVRKIVDSLKKPEQFDANSAVSEIKNLRKDAKKAYRQGDTELGKGALEASSALEDLLDRHAESLAAQGKIPLGAMNLLRQARVRIAKSYAADRALNPITGEINPQEYAKLLHKRAPLTGAGKKMAELAGSFQRSAQKPSHIPTGPQYGDVLMALLRAKGGNLLKELPFLFARPVVREALASKPGQYFMDPTRNMRLMESLGVSTIPRVNPVPQISPVTATQQPQQQNENVPITSVRG